MVRRNNKSRRNQSQNKRQNKRNTRKQNGGLRKRGKAMLYTPLHGNISAKSLQDIIKEMGYIEEADQLYLVRLRDQEE